MVVIEIVCFMWLICWFYSFFVLQPESEVSTTAEDYSSEVRQHFLKYKSSLCHRNVPFFPFSIFNKSKFCFFWFLHAVYWAVYVTADVAVLQGSHLQHVCRITCFLINCLSYSSTFCHFILSFSWSLLDIILVSSENRNCKS